MTRGRFRVAAAGSVSGQRAAASPIILWDHWDYWGALLRLLLRVGAPRSGISLPRASIT